MTKVTTNQELGNWAYLCWLNLQLTRKLETVQKALDACTIYEDYTENNVYLNPSLREKFKLLSEVAGDILSSIPDYTQEANYALEKFVEGEIELFNRQNCVAE